MISRTDCGPSIARSSPLSALTTLGVGGPADILCRPRDVQDVARAVALARDESRPWRVIGRGSNLVVDDAGVDGLVLDLRALRRLEIDDDGGVVAGAGLPTSLLLRETRARGLGGLECVVGYPASVGGAVRMNAGGRWGCVGERVESVVVVDADGEVREMTAAECAFAYRSSALAGVAVVEARLRLPRVDAREYRAAVDEIHEAKSSAQPLHLRTAGCMFKNPVGSEHGAGRLIHLCEALGRRRGGAAVSDVHGNFFVNLGGATAADVLALADDVRSLVDARFGVALELEVEVWRRGDA